MKDIFWMKPIVFAALLSVVSGCQKKVESDSTLKTILVRSVGEVEALPDEAKFQVSLSCLDRSVKASKNCLVTKSNELIARLESLGIQKRDILTTTVSLDKSYTWRANSSVFEGYRSATSLVVTVKNIESLDEIYTELLENRNLELSGLSYSHSKMDSLNNEAYAIALKKSGALADKLLEALPEDEKEVFRIANVEINSTAPRLRGTVGDATSEQASPVANRSIGISSGTVKVEATLFVEYQID